MRYPQLSGTLLTQSLNVLSTFCGVQISLIFLGSLSELKGVTSVWERAPHLSGLHLLNTVGADTGKHPLSCSLTAINREVTYSAKQYWIYVCSPLPPP